MIRYRKLINLVVFVATIIASPEASFCQVSGTAQIEWKILDSTGKPIGYYEGSYALLIGMKDYQAGWKSLPNVEEELNSLESILTSKRHGFVVIKKINLTAEKARKTLRAFKSQYGYQKDNRLLIFFTGHGFTRNEANSGYLVPIDAPLPKNSMDGFYDKALSMNEIKAYARDLKAKHVLFLFDSCFSGAIFNTKAQPVIRFLTHQTFEEARIFLTTGNADQTVPAKSVFIPALIEGLKGAADQDEDTHITGTELGEYVKDEIVEKGPGGLTPQFGRMREYGSYGDFVFPSVKKHDRNCERENVSEVELAYWATVSVSNDIKMYEEYLKQFPGGCFSGLARIELEKLKRKSLIVNTHPSNAEVKFLNLAKTYEHGIILDPGIYNLIVSHEGYDSEQIVVKIRESDKKKEITVELKRSLYALTVETQPKDASIHILPIEKSFTQGILLRPGRYYLRVEKEGYKSKRLSVDITDGDKFVRVTLKRVAYKLFVKTTPSDARIQIVNIRPRYEPGIMLQPGSYRLKITKPRYRTYNAWIKITDDDRNLFVKLRKLRSHYRLTVETVPSNAKVRILNIIPPYRPGMRLQPANYHIEVSKPGYQTRELWKRITDNDRLIKIRLEPVRYRLTVTVKPDKARVRIMNIKPKYKPGILLYPGRYHIKVSLNGYKTITKTITLNDANKNISYKLEKK